MMDAHSSIRMTPICELCTYLPYFSDKRFVLEDLTVGMLMDVCLAIRNIVIWVRSPCSLHTFTSPLLPHSKRHTKSHTLCRRCGNRAFHRQHKSVSSRCYLWIGFHVCEFSVCVVRLPLGKNSVIQLGHESQEAKDYWHRSHASFEGCQQAIQERV